MPACQLECLHRYYEQRLCIILMKPKHDTSERSIQIVKHVHKMLIFTFISSSNTILKANCVIFFRILRNKDEGWVKEDHLRFQYILEQYAVDMPNRRSLYIDRMMREMPHLSRHDIVSFS